MRRLLAAVLVASVVSGAVAACGSAGDDVHSGQRGITTGPARIDIYSSLPLSGSEAVQGSATADGIRLAFSQAHFRTGHLRIRYLSLNDSGRAGPWSPTLTLRNASQAARDPNAGYYIGELDPDASVVSSAVVSLAGFAQVTPADGPARGRAATFLSLTPGAEIQADAMLQALRIAGCKRVGVAYAGGSGGALQTTIRSDAAAARIRVVDTVSVRDVASSLQRAAVSLRSGRIDCLVYEGDGLKSALALGTVVHQLMPSTKLLATSATCRPQWTAIAASAYCISPLLPVAEYPGGAGFAKVYARAYGHAPASAYALYGYEAAELFLAHAAQLGRRTADRRLFARTLAATVRPVSVLGPYSFDSNGDTTTRDYGLYTGDGDGGMRFYRRLLTS